jgi:peptidoglycan/LPS O-acetylase OafA/YrhL
MPARQSIAASGRRGDIDVLRAVAVMAVLLFHFDVPGFAGGFLGVDIFFVISGYLISLHIQQQLAASTFSFKAFYLRRIRRLYPAMLATLLLCSVLALFLLPKSLLEEFTRSQVAAALYLSNVHFWSIADYFDSASIYKPLLHTWSLAVEEQFYIVWPVFLMLCFGRHLRLAIGLALLISVVAAEVVWAQSPAAAFYLFPFRIFEFATGAMVCGLSLARLPRRLRDLLLLVAGATIFASLLLLDERSRNPGLLTLPVCVATALVIALQHAWLDREGLLFRGVLRIGRISYSAYLVHWPLVVFYKITHPGELGPWTALVMILASLLLAEAMYRWVEQPTARLSLTGHRRLLFSSIPATVLVALVIQVGFPLLYPKVHPAGRPLATMLDEIPDRQSTLKQARAEFEASRPAEPARDRQHIVVVGDSHAEDVYWGLSLVLQADSYQVSLQHSICDPLDMASIQVSLQTLYRNHPQDPVKNPEYCRPIHESLLDDLATHKPDLVVFSEDWRDEALAFLPATIGAIHLRLPGTPVLILGRNFQLGGNPQVVFRDLQDADAINSTAWARRYKRPDKLDRKLRAIARRTDSDFISKMELVCPGQRCWMVLDDHVAFTDSQLWTVAGMRHFGELLVQQPEFRSALD